jgi:glycosyltransferase involved in cell wall biosynthesis
MERIAEASSDTPTVSVIIPTYNRARFLGRAIRSVLEQTYTDFELIVVDDHSDEDPTPLVETFEDPRLHYVRHEENQGNAATRNTAIRMARGRYLAFLDDDDEWEPEKLELQIPMLDESAPDEAMVYCPRRLVQDGEVVGIDAPGKEGDVLDELLPWGLMQCSAVVLKADVLEHTGMFDERLQRGVDEDLWRRIARHYRVRYLDKVLVTCHVGHDERVSRVETPKEIREDIFRWEDKLEKFRAEFEERPAGHAVVMRRLGERHIQLGELREGRRYLRKAIALQPQRVDAWGMLLASVFGRRGLVLFLRIKESVMQRVRPLFGSLGYGGWRRKQYASWR